LHNSHLREVTLHKETEAFGNINENVIVDTISMKLSSAVPCVMSFHLLF
jgi:hypothetical protein